MVQNGRHFAIDSGNIVSSSIRPMKLGSIGFLMMQNLNLNISDRSHDRKWLKMAAFIGKFQKQHFLLYKANEIGYTGFLMMPNSILTISRRSRDRKWFKMAAVLVYNTGDIISSTIRPMKLCSIGFLMMQNLN